MSTYRPLPTICHVRLSQTLSSTSPSWQTTTLLYSTPTPTTSLLQPRVIVSYTKVKLNAALYCHTVVITFALWTLQPISDSSSFTFIEYPYFYLNWPLVSSICIYLLYLTFIILYTHRLTIFYLWLHSL